MRFLATKFKIDKTFIICLIICLLKGQLLNLAFLLIAVILHELAHSYVAYGRGYILDTVTLMPYGAVLSGEDEFKDSDAFIISFAGPIFSFILALLTLSVWWIFPIVKTSTEYFFNVNIMLAVFNLLPIYPLDGGRMALSKAKDKRKTLKTLKKIAIAVSFGFLGLFILSAFYTINYFLAVMSISLFVSSVFEHKNNDYIHIVNKSLNIKSKNNVIHNKSIYVSKDTKLIKILKEVDYNYYLTVNVLNDDLSLLTQFNEEKLVNIFLNNPLETSVGEILTLLS